jgi:hypothetical protein
MHGRLGSLVSSLQTICPIDVQRKMLMRTGTLFRCQKDSRLKTCALDEYQKPVSESCPAADEDHGIAALSTHGGQHCVGDIPGAGVVRSHDLHHELSATVFLRLSLGR